MKGEIKLKKKGILLLVLILLLSMAVGCTQGGTAGISSINDIKERGKIRIGVFGDKPPFGFVDAEGKNQGFDVYIAKQFAKDLLGDENALEFILVEAASRVEYLQSDKVDIILANFTVTDERKEMVDFANPYMKVALGVVSPDGAPIKNIEELKGQKLIVNKGTTAEKYFTENYPDIELLKYDQNTEAFNALKDGRGAALAHDNTLLFAWAKENEGFTTSIEFLGNQDTIAPAVKKGNTELLGWINEELKVLGENNFIHEAYDATLLPIYGADVDPESVVVEGGVVK